MLFFRNGLLEKSNEAVKEQNKAQYFDIINIQIATEKIKRYEDSNEQEAFITSLKNSLKKEYSWIDSIISCDSYYVQNPNDYDNNTLIIHTKDGFEIRIKINNDEFTANIEDSFEKIKENMILTYDSNNGTGLTNTQEVKEGFDTKLQQTTFNKTNYNFVGWCFDKDGNSTIFSGGSVVSIDKNTTIYAIWKQHTAVITLNSNNTSNTTTQIQCAIDDKGTQLPENTFTQESYRFLNWNTEPDGSGIQYNDNSLITPTSDITLYAQWKKYYTISFNANGGTGTMPSQQIDEGTTITLTNKFSKTGYQFNYWSSNTDEIYNNNEMITPTSDITLKAQWKEIYRFFKIIITKLKSTPNDNAIQMSEWSFFKENKTKYSYGSSKSISSNLSGLSGETIGNLIDNNASTKYCSTSWGSSQTGTCTIIIDLGSGNYISPIDYPYYSYYTANDQSSRDPISWTMYASYDGSSYDLVSTVSDESITSSRNSLTSYWSWE